MASTVAPASSAAAAAAAAPAVKGGRVYPKRKINFVAKLNALMSEYKKIVFVLADFVGSRQMAQIRKALRGKAVLLMGKNTMARSVIRKRLATEPQWEPILQRIKGNVGLVFTNLDPADIRKVCLDNRVPAAAKPGVIAPVDFIVPAGPTTLDPGQTAFFQALNISTKIARGAIEILTDVHIIHKGVKVGNSEVALLTKLNLKPFTYGLDVLAVFEEGGLYDAALLDIDQKSLTEMFIKNSGRLAALSLAMCYPTAASIAHIMSDAFRNLVAIALETDYVFPEAQKIKDLISNPEALKAAQAAAAAAAAAPAAEEKKEEKKETKKKEEKKEEPAEEPAAGMGSLFGDE